MANKKVNRLTLSELTKKKEHLESKNEHGSKYYRHIVAEIKNKEIKNG